MARLQINIGVDEAEQESNFQNACLSGIDDLAISIAVYPPTPKHDVVMSEQDLKKKFEKDFSHLVELGYDVIIAIGSDNDEETD